MGSVQKVGRAVEKAYEADALTIACQVYSLGLLVHLRLGTTHLILQHDIGR